MGTIESFVPVVFSDVDRDIRIGNIKISPSMQFKNFQLVLSDTIGVSPYQISVYYVDQRKDFRVAVTHKFNFSTISRDTKSSYFHVFLKRSRREKRRRSYEIDANNNGNSFGLENMVLLRRNDVNNSINALQQRYQKEYESRMMELQMQREQFLIMSAAAATAGDKRNTSNFSSNNDFYLEKWDDGEEAVEEFVCADCERGEPGFHPCVKDPTVVNWFSTKAGPIARPRLIPPSRFGSLEQPGSSTSHAFSYQSGPLHLYNVLQSPYSQVQRVIEIRTRQLQLQQYHHHRHHHHQFLPIPSVGLGGDHHGGLVRIPLGQGTGTGVFLPRIAASSTTPLSQTRATRVKSKPSKKQTAGGKNMNRQERVQDQASPISERKSMSSSGLGQSADFHYQLSPPDMGLPPEWTY